MRKDKNIGYTFPAQNRLGEYPCALGWRNAATAAQWWKGAGSYELPARTAGFTLLPSVLPVLPGALQGRDCLFFCVRVGPSLGCSLVNVRYTE